MGILYKAVLPLLCIAPLLLQAADPPTDVDRALRSRVQEFYQLQVDRKYRQAEQLVAADTKDLYYVGQKPDLKAFSIKSIEYAPDFRSARVAVSLRRVIMFPGAGPQTMDMPAITTWKIDNGAWCWYVDQSKLMDTPLGHFKPGPDNNSDVSKLMGRVGSMDGVHAEPLRVELDPRHPVPQTVTLKNTLPGPVTIESLTSSPVLKIQIAKPNLGADESTQLTITPVAADGDLPGQVVLKIGPLGQQIVITLEYIGANYR